jgi:hypothetical protein
MDRRRPGRRRSGTGAVEVRVKRVLLRNGDEMRLHEEPGYVLRWELVTTARLYDALPVDVRRIGRDPYSSAPRS